MAQNEIKLLLTIDGKQAIAAINNTDEVVKKLYQSFKYGKQEINGFTTAISQGFNNAREIIQGFKETVSVISGIFNSSLSSYQNQEKANVQLATAMKQAGTYTDQAYQSLVNYSVELQKFTVYGDDATTTVMAQLQAMGLNAEQTKAATLQVANLASLMGTDLNGAARIMADLFQGNTGLIGRYIKGIDETAIKSGNLDLIIQELNKHIGGQAEALGNTAFGSVAKFNNAIDDMRENIGGALSTALMPFVEHISKLITNLNETSPALTGIIGAIGTLGAATATLSVTGIMPMIINFKTLTSGLQYGAGIFKMAAAEGMALRGSLMGIGTAAKGLMASIGPAGWLIIGITVFTEAINLLSTANDKLSESEREVVNSAEAEKIKFDQLTKTILDQNKSLAERNKAKEEAQKIYPGFLENLSIEKTKNDDLTAAVSKGRIEFGKLIEMKILNQRLDLAIQDLAKKKNEDIAPGFWDSILGAAQSLINGTPGMINAQVNAAVNHAESVADAEKKINDILAEINKQPTESSGGNKGLSPDELKKLFEKNKAELSEAQRHQQAMLKITSDNDYLMLAMKIKHFNQMIELYKKFGQETTNLVNQRTETESELNKKVSESVLPREYVPDLKKKYELNERNAKEISDLNETHAREDLRISELTTNEKLNLLDEQKAGVANAMGEIAGVFAKHTLAYQAFAKAQALIDTYTAAQSAYKSLVGIPFVGPALAVAAAAAAIAAGLARVEQIGKVQIPGYALGGKLPKGQTGFIEGYQNEIIAPEKTFVEIFRQELRPQIYSNNVSSNYDLSGIKDSISKLNRLIEQGIVARAYLDNREARKITVKGNYLNNKSKL
ncbi:MAG: hypothetical protein B6D44_15245 [Ignavibacteriales bacterium UTCHB2]|jgi:hypothetical protein|nr:MAG: hypothetical protein B6D44_15245 [Ignavibacteriales bacterium UTCHB2]